jgi:hypothetical protein
MWRASIVGMYVRPHTSNQGSDGNGETSAAAASAVAVEMTLPAAVRSQYGYGAPTTVWLLVTEPPPTDHADTSTAAAGSGRGGMLDLEVELVWGGKAATRLYEGIYFEIKPALQQPTAAYERNGPDGSNGSKGPSVGGAQEAEEGWRLLVDKIGRQVDTADVVTHGGSAVHGIDPNGGVTFARSATVNIPTTDGSESTAGLPLSLHVDSLDGGLIMPTAAGHVWNFTAFFTPPTGKNTVGIAPDPADGVSFNLMNNQYWTNYVLWYPYTEADATLRSRFEMVLDHTPNAWTFSAVER